MLHQQAGEQLVRHLCSVLPQIATQLARHFELGRGFARASQHVIQAGDNATKLYANASAEHLRTRLVCEKLPLEAQPETLVTLYQKRGAVTWR